MSREPLLESSGSREAADGLEQFRGNSGYPEEETEGAKRNVDMGGWRNYWVVRWSRTKIRDPLLLIFRRGTDPKQMAMSGALGITLGIFPIYGVTVFLCGAAAGMLGNKCNVPTLMLANLIATPVELILVVPFLRLGELLLGGHPFMLTRDALWKAVTLRLLARYWGRFYMQLTTWGAVPTWNCILQLSILTFEHGMGGGAWFWQLVGWVIAAPFICMALYISFCL